LLKVFNFWAGTTGFFACTYHLRRTQTDATEWFLLRKHSLYQPCHAAEHDCGGLIQLCAKAQYWSGRLFNLAFYHPNTSGPLYAQFILYLVCVYFFTGYRNRWICLPLTPRS